MRGIALYFLCQYSPNSEVGKRSPNVNIISIELHLPDNLQTQRSLYLPDSIKQQGVQSPHLLDNLKHEGEKGTEDLLTIL